MDVSFLFEPPTNLLSQSQAQGPTQEQAMKEQAPEETFEDKQEMAQKIESLMHAESEATEQPEECSAAFLNDFTRFDMPPQEQPQPQPHAAVNDDDEPPPLECKVIEVSDGCCGGAGMVVVDDDEDTQQNDTEGLTRFSKESDLRTYKVADLRDLLRSNGLSTSGLRRDLVKRILQASADARQ